MLSGGRLKRRTKSKNVYCLHHLLPLFKSYSANSSSPDNISVKVAAHSFMATTSVCNCSQSQIPICGCNRAMRMFISYSIENPKQRLWRSSYSGVMANCKLFIWDDKLERNTSNESKNSTGCNCTEVVQELGYIIKDLEEKKKEKMKFK